jgi:DNA-binding CsgD family transcriptional regulator
MGTIFSRVAGDNGDVITPRSPLVGRDDARRQLDAAATSARMGNPGLVLVSGEAGIGKTRLVSDGLSTLGGDDVLAKGSGVDLRGGEMPFVVLSSSLRSLVQRFGLDAVRGWAGHDVSRLGTLVRQLGPDSAVVCEPLEIIDAFQGLVSRLSDTRFVWWGIEDLQWADSWSMDAVRYVVQLMQPGERLLVSCTLRTHDRRVSPEMSSFLSELVRSPVAHQIRLTRLHLDEVRLQLSALRAGDVSDRLLERVMLLAGGVPFLTEELVTAGLAETGPLPASATELMLSRVASLDPEARAVVSAASVAQDHLHDLWLGLVTGLPPSSVENALTTLVHGNVLDVDGSAGEYRFHHALMREAVAEAMLPGETTRWHRRWAEALSTLDVHERDLSTSLAIAHHWDRAGVPDPAFASAVAAGLAAEVMGAQGERAVLLCRALRWWPLTSDGIRGGHDRDDLVEQALWACGLSGRAELGVEMLARQSEFPDDSEERLVRGLRLDLARARLERGLEGSRSPVDPPALNDQIALLHRSSPSALFARAVAELVADSHDIETSESLDGLLTDALSAANDYGSFLDRMDVQDTRSHHLKVLGHLQGAADLILELLRESGDRLPLSDVMRLESNAVSHLFDVGRFAQAAAIGRRSMARLPNPRLSPGVWSSLAENLAATLIETGDWSDAALYLARIFNLDPPVHTACVALIDTARLHCRRGDLSAAQDRLAEAGHGVRSPSSPPRLRVLRELVAAEVDLAADDPGFAWARLTPLWRGGGPHDFVLKRDAVLLAARALTAARRLHAREAIQTSKTHLGELSDAAAGLPSGVWSPTWQARFGVEHARCLGEDTQEQWRRCVLDNQRLGQPYEEGWALVGLARRALEDRSIDVAREALRHARAVAETLGSGLLADGVREEAGRGRIALDEGDHRSRSSTSTHGLTGRELEVLRLVSDGYRNDEIGKALFISPKTVSVHVSRILAKLGVTSRGAASAVAHREALFVERTHA